MLDIDDKLLAESCGRIVVGKVTDSISDLPQLTFTLSTLREVDSYCPFLNEYSDLVGVIAAVMGSRFALCCATKVPW